MTVAPWAFYSLVWVLAISSATNILLSWLLWKME